MWSLRNPGSASVLASYDVRITPVSIAPELVCRCKGTRGAHVRSISGGLVCLHMGSISERTALGPVNVPICSCPDWKPE